MLRTLFLSSVLVAGTLPVAIAQEELGDDYGYAEVAGGYLTAQTAVMRGDAPAALGGFLAALGADSSNLGLQQDAFAAALLTGDVDTAVRLAKVLPRATDSQTMIDLVKMAEAARENDAETVLALSRRLERSVPELLQFKLLQAYAERARGVAVESVIKQLGPVEGIPAQQSRQLYHMGRMRLQVGDTKGALDALEQAYALEPGSLFTTSLLAQVYQETGQDKLADEVLMRFMVANPQMALLGMHGGQPTPMMDEVLANDVGEVLFDFGVLVWAQGAELTARQIFNLALWLAPKATYATYYSAMIEEHTGSFEVAQARYQSLLNDPQVGDAARLRLAELTFKQGDPESAARQVEDLLRDYPDDIGALRARAEMAFERQEYARAAKGYEQILKRLPTETDAETEASLWFALGAARERMGKIDAATDALQKSLAYQPTNPSVLNYLGYMWVEHGENLEQAFVLLNSALMLAPQDGAIMDSVGWAYFLRGESEQALVFLEQAAELSPDDPVIVDHLGDAYLKEGRVLEAGWQWQRAIILAGKKPDVEEYAKVGREAAHKLKRYK